MNKFISTKDYPVKYFKEFFLEGGYDKYRNDFLNYGYQLMKKSPDNVHVMADETEITIFITVANSIGEPSCETEVFTNNLYRDLKNEVEKSKNLLRDAQVEKYENIDAFINSQRVIIRDIFDANNKLFDSLPKCRKLINELDMYIVNIKSFDKVEAKNNEQELKKEKPKVYKKYNDDDVIKYSLFAQEDVSNKFLKELHSMLCKYSIIEELFDSNEGEQQFVDIFASEKPSELKYSIKFRKKNYETVLIFNTLKKYFKNLTPINIERSQCFVNKKGKFFNANDINVINNKIKNHSFTMDKEVKRFIDEFSKLIPSVKSKR